MNVLEIIESIDTMVPNSIPLKEKVKWLNQIQNQLYRDYPFEDAILRVLLIVGQSFYPLPANFTEQQAQSFIVNNREIPYISFYDGFFVAEQERFWTVIEGQLFVNPVPPSPDIGYLYYKKSPLQLTENNLETIPDLPLDFHELYVLGGCARAAKASAATLPLVDMYQSDFLRLAEKADLSLAKVRQKQVSLVHKFT